jgi:hypothetical protein
MFLMTPPIVFTPSEETLAFKPQYRLRFERRFDRDFNKNRDDIRTQFFGCVQLGFKF